MPKANTSSMHENHTVEIVDNNPSANETSDEESTISEQEVFLTPNHLQVEAHKRYQVICLI